MFRCSKGLFFQLWLGDPSHMRRSVIELRCGKMTSALLSAYCLPIVQFFEYQFDKGRFDGQIPIKLSLPEKISRPKDRPAKQLMGEMDLIQPSAQGGRMQNVRFDGR